MSHFGCLRQITFDTENVILAVCSIKQLALQQRNWWVCDYKKTAAPSGSGLFFYWNVNIICMVAYHLLF